MINIQDKKDCCGCTACASVCNHGAITIQPDECGFVIPRVNPALCVDCHLCEQVCPIAAKCETNQPEASFVALAVDQDEQLSSTSGGLASVFARCLIGRLQGVVYGCTGADCFNVRHIRIDSLDGLEQIKGSKYVQSNMTGIYEQVRQDLRQGRYVLFVGTPCQVAGLRKFLRKPNERLFCIDFVCHGVPPQQLLSSAIKEKGLKTLPKEARFRIKSTGKPSKYCLQVVSADGAVLYEKGYGRDPYITGFIYALFYRDSCYSCPYASLDRPGDITVGDFWDREREFVSMDRRKGGLSQMHVNTGQGKRLLHLAEDSIRKQPIAIDKLLKHSQQLSHPMPRHRNNALFWRLYHQKGFHEACRVALRKDIRSLRLQPISSVLFAIPGVRNLYFTLKKLLKG